MKVLFLAQSLSKAGAERLVLEISNAINVISKDISVKIVSLATENEYPSLSKGLDIEYCSSNVHVSIFGKSVINISEFEKIVDKFNPDVIHSHTYKAELVSRENPRKGIKYFTHVHGPFLEFEKFTFKTLVNKLSFTRFFERSRIFKRYRKINNQFITISSLIDTQLRNQLEHKWNSKIHFMPNAIDYSKFHVKPKSISSNTIRLVSVGRMFPEKNQTFLLDVMSKLIYFEPNINWRLLIAGVGPLKDSLSEKINKLDLNKHVALPGLVDNIEQTLKISHLYLHSATFEPFGLTMMEAMASSLPIISIDGGGNKDFILNEYNGYIFNQETRPEIFAKAIIKLVTDKGKYLKMAHAANETAKEYDIIKYTEKLIKLYS
jgi:glycosyltransferase involved in cell wall biosynthesis